jgi:hypothetical protein
MNSESRGPNATITDRDGDNMELSYDIPPPAQVKTIKF